jgi:hypothetical protein
VQYPDTWPVIRYWLSIDPSNTWPKLEVIINAPLGVTFPVSVKPCHGNRARPWEMVSLGAGSVTHGRDPPEVHVFPALLLTAETPTYVPS